MNKLNYQIIIKWVLYRFKLSDLDTILSFGKYKGEKINQILNKQPSYINFAVENIESIFFRPELLKSIKVNYPSLFISKEAIANNEHKFKLWEERERIYNKKRRSTNPDNHGLEPNDSEDFYNDSLDMDQQSESFYNTVFDGGRNNYNYEEEEDIFLPLYTYAIEEEIYSMQLCKNKNGDSFIELFKYDKSEQNEFLFETILTENGLKVENLLNLAIVKKNNVKVVVKMIPEKTKIRKNEDSLGDSLPF